MEYLINTFWLVLLVAFCIGLYVGLKTPDGDLV